MSVSFEKHREKIQSAWKDVIDDKTPTDWALFGYEGQSNDLKVVGTGDGGLEELCDDLNSGKIMYAFVRVNDTKAGLTKFLLINWQGEGAPVLKKGTCANHIHDVAKVLTGAHLTINARVEDDIDNDRILQKLRNITASVNIKESRIEQDEQKAPVGTNYSRVIPAKELNPVEMLNFWKKEEEEEKHRIELEKERKRLELILREEEQRSREEKEHRERELKIAESTKLQSAHVPIKTSPQPLSPIKTLSSPTRVMTEAEKMRQQRSQEARELIGSRVGTAKAIFTQNTSDGQMQTKNAPVKPVRNSIAQRINALNNVQNETVEKSNIPNETVSNDIVETNETPTIIETVEETPASQSQEVTAELVTNIQNDDDSSEHEEQFSTIKRSPHSKSNSLASPEEPSVTESKSFVSSDTAKTEIKQTTNGQGSDNISDEDLILQDFLNDGGLKARALYDYQAADESEITFDPGDIISHIDQIDEGWWQGLGPDGTYGLFPANYVELIN